MVTLHNGPVQKNRKRNSKTNIPDGLVCVYNKSKETIETDGLVSKFWCFL